MEKLLLILSFSCIVMKSWAGTNDDKALLEKNLIASNTQIEILKNQINLITSYQDKLLSTVYWSLGGIITLTVLLIGFNWFINVRNQDKEIENLKNIIKNKINDAEFDLKKDVYSSLDTRIKTAVSLLERKVIYLEIDISEQKCEKWILKKVYANALREQSNILKLLSQINSNYRTSLAFEKITEILELIIKEQKKSCLKPDLIKEIFQSMKLFQDSHQFTITKIEKILNDY